jgi:hypothetical protein
MVDFFTDYHHKSFTASTLPDTTTVTAIS